MSAAHSARRVWIAGIAVAALGVLCLGSGIAVLVWRLAQPEQATRLLPVMLVTPPPTLTPGVLGTPLPPPPLPAERAAIVILPESENPSPTPQRSPTVLPPMPAAPVGGATITPSAQASVMAPARTATPTRLPTVTLAATRLPATRTATAWPSPAAPGPSATPTPPILAPERLVIRRIGLAVPVVPVGQHALQIGAETFSQWDVPRQRAAGWHQGSAGLGQPGNLVLNGHHNIYGEVFRYLALLEPGDVITLEGGGRRFHYAVVQTMTLAEQGQPAALRQDNARWILPTADERVTLVTCWPYYANTHRLVVIARPLEMVIPPEDIP